MQNYYGAFFGEFKPHGLNAGLISETGLINSQ